MTHIYCINGSGGAGKDSFVRFVAEIIGASNVLNISTVDKVKEVARSLGWKGTKTLEDRKCLSDLKDMMTYWSDTPFQDIVKKARLQIDEWEEFHVKDTFIFIHVREPEGIARLVSALGAKSILIRRPSDILFTNHADAEVENYNYDIEIVNDKDLTNLKGLAQTFVEDELE